MKWLNLETKKLHSPEYIGSAPVERATWFNILAYCCEQENGGRLVGAKAWKDRQWQQLCGVTKREVGMTTRLLKWDGEDLIVDGYNMEKEFEVQQMRALGSSNSAAKSAAARVNGANGGRPKTQRGEHSDNPTETQREEPKPNPTETHRKEIEGKGIRRELEGKENEKKNGNGTTLPPSSTAGGVVEGNGNRRLPTTEQSKRIATIFHRRLTTAWADDEVKAYHKLGIIPADDLSAVERYYSENWPPERDKNILRHDMLTFLNNFTGEVDRANSNQPKTFELQTKGPKGWSPDDE